ncbi:MAG: hypothetical protein HOO04_00050 [Phycisphaerae bacterium]|jgi:hypothetical protein|nr:hypothetical protein [Phycisphaerae bacterium]MBT5656165.1 hypothetical protein [Phycisphaerae bacterium]
MASRSRRSASWQLKQLLFVVHTVVQHDVPMPGNISGDHLRILKEGVTLHALHIKSRNFDGCMIMHGNANRARPEARSIYLYRFQVSGHPIETG